MKIPGILVAAPASGSGKTAAACGLMSAYRQQHISVRAAKCGPDYIDPMFHKQVLGVDSGNLDLFFCDREDLKSRFRKLGQGADLMIVEGVMGYYDGITFGSTEGSACEIADTLGLPVILVLPCRGMAASALALLKGMVEYQNNSRVRGILLNQIPPAIYPKMKSMIEAGLREMGHEEIRVVGYLPGDDAFQFESRHLGLVTPAEIKNLTEQLDRAGRLVSETVDLKLLYEIAQTAEEIRVIAEQDAGLANGTDCIKREAPVRIAVARDEAFCFYYKDNLDMLREKGCDLLFFSPLRDRHLPDCDALVIGGGYPEIYAGELSKNRSLLEDIRKRLSGGLPCLAECGGFQYLQSELEGMDGTMYPMAGVISSQSRNGGRLARFGYVTIEGQRDGIYLKRGEKIRGHEFHHWDSTDNGKDCLAVKPDGARTWSCIHMEGNLFAGYPHLYYPSNPDFVERFIETARAFRAEKVN